MNGKSKFVGGRGYTEADWKAVDSPELTETELADMKPAKQVLPPEFFSTIEEARRARGRPRIPAPKAAVTLRLDPSTLARFKAKGKDWRSKMAELLDKS